MKYIILISFVFISVISLSQDKVKGKIIDATTLEPLAYCNIAVKNEWYGTITNVDGEFELNVNIETDTIIVSYIGYETSIFPARIFDDKKTINLKRKKYNLDESTIYAGTDFLYDILIKAKRKLKRGNTVTQSKVYYGLETEASGFPTELLECYYNASFYGSTLSDLIFKNGRVGLNPIDNYFMTFNTSKALYELDVTKEKDYFPLIPLQASKGKMKKTFDLELVYSDKEVFNIKYTPKVGKEGFSGNVWVEVGTMKIKKITLQLDRPNRHPFIPLFKCDSISDISISLSKVYKEVNNEIFPDYINFEYGLNYHSIRDSTSGVSYEKTISRYIYTKGLMYFYDYGDPFILPYYNYDYDLNDYKKMSIIPYNDDFWSNNNKLLLTENQKEDLGLFATDGTLINFNPYLIKKNKLNVVGFVAKDTVDFFRYSNVFWDKSKRVRLDPNRNLKDPAIRFSSTQPVLDDQYNLDVQILFDVNKIGDSICWKSYTVFDTYRTFYRLPKEEYTEVFINIYFDICEIERRRMEEDLTRNNYTVVQIDSVYNKTLKDLSLIERSYFKQTMVGRKKIFIESWNKYVLDNLGVDNIKMFIKSEEEE